MKRLCELESIDVFKKFESICVENINRSSLLDYSDNIKAEVISEDARHLTENIYQKPEGLVLGDFL